MLLSVDGEFIASGLVLVFMWMWMWWATLRITRRIGFPDFCSRASALNPANLLFSAALSAFWFVQRLQVLLCNCIALCG